MQHGMDDKRADHLGNLLHTMARVLKYDFDRTHIKNSSYSPRGHGDIENENAILRKGLIEVLDGRKKIPIDVFNTN